MYVPPDEPIHEMYETNMNGQRARKNIEQPDKVVASAYGGRYPAANNEASAIAVNPIFHG